MTTISPDTSWQPGHDYDTPPDLSRNMADGRAMRNTIYTAALWIIAILASVPLFSVLYMLIVRGGSRLGTALFTELPPAGFAQGGGFGNAILGTLVMVAIASALSVPFGIMGGVLLGFVGPHSRVGDATRFIAKVLTGFPSILAGVFVYTWLVLAMGAYSAIAGGVALAVLMLPTIMLTSEQAIRMVPQRMKDAAYGMGCTQSQAILKVVLPTALPGILTGIMLAVAGAAGNSAPLLFTALFSNYWMTSLTEPTASLAILIYNFSGMPFPNQIELAWAASLVLVIIVLIFNVLSRMVGSSRV